LPGEDCNEDGDLYVWPENQEAAGLWLVIGDQWLLSGGIDSQIVGFNMTVALEFARELAKVDSMIKVLPLVQKIRCLADLVLPLLKERKAAKGVS